MHLCHEISVFLFWIFKYLFLIFFILSCYFIWVCVGMCFALGYSLFMYLFVNNFFDLFGYLLLHFDASLEICIGECIFPLEDWYYLHEHDLILFLCIFIGFEAVLKCFTMNYVLLGNFTFVCVAYHQFCFSLVAIWVESLVYLPFQPLPSVMFAYHF